MEEKILKSIIEYAKDMVAYEVGNEQFHKGKIEAYKDIKKMLEDDQETGRFIESIRKPDSVLTPQEALLRTLEIRDEIREGWKPVDDEDVWYVEFCFGRWSIGVSLNERSLYTFRTNGQAILFKEKSEELLPKVEEIL